MMLISLFKLASGKSSNTLLTTTFSLAHLMLFSEIQLAISIRNPGTPLCKMVQLLKPRGQTSLLKSLDMFFKIPASK
jgi:hypothetical protein